MAEKKATSLDRYLLLCDQLLVFLVKRFSIKFQFSNCNILVTCHIDSATPRYQPTHPLEKSRIRPCSVGNKRATSGTGRNVNFRLLCRR